MSRNLHLIVKPDKAAGQTFAPKDGGRLLLRRAGPFEVAVREYEEATAPLNKAEEDAAANYNRKRAALEQGGWTPDEMAAIKKEHAAYEKKGKERSRKEDAVKASFADVRWEWCTVGRGLHLAQNSINPVVAKGPARRFIQFPKALEGGGYAWVEAFHESVGPTGKVPFGCYVAATGTPKIVAGEWKDGERKKIEKVVAFGSTVSLHIYTEGLYGQDIEIQLMDNDRVAAALSAGGDEAPAGRQTGTTAAGKGRLWAAARATGAFFLEARPGSDVQADGGDLRAGGQDADGAGVPGGGAGGGVFSHAF